MSAPKSDWKIPAALIALSLVPAVAGIARLAQLGGGADITPENARFFASPLAVLLHIPAAIVYSILGAFQFSPSIRRRRRGWHRVAGLLLVPCGLIVAATGLWMAQFYPWPAGDGVVVYIERLLAGSVMLAFILVGLNSIRRRDFTSHGDWMTRAYAVGLGAGTQVLTHLPWFVFANEKPGEVPRALMMGAGWAINILVAEGIIRRRHVRPGVLDGPDGPGHDVATPGNYAGGGPSLIGLSSFSARPNVQLALSSKPRIERVRLDT